jgi:pyruvate carboxylase
MSKDVTDKNFQYKLTLNNVFRDFSQGLYGNRIPLDDPDAREIAALWNELNATNTPENLVQFDAFEAGGAQVQVDSVFLNKDPNETLRAIREAAPDATIRPLWRGKNGFKLEPSSYEDRFQVLRQMAVDTASPYSSSKNEELLRVKVFDSQGSIAEVEETVEMIAKLCKENFKIGVEVALPYSNGEGCDSERPGFNPYPDELFVTKALQAADLAAKYGIPNHLFRISLKDMVGELAADKAGILVGKIIDGLKKKGLNITLGLHLHDTGLASGAYAAAIRVCKEKNWPLAIDVVEAHDMERGDDKSGFVSTERLQSHHIDLGFSEKQKEIIASIRACHDRIEERYKLRRTDVTLPAEQRRLRKLPGGGFASFASAITAMNLAGQLAISPDDAAILAGAALTAVGRVMGDPFAVTPGFQNKQIAALNLLTNMLNAKHIRNDMSMDDLQKSVLTVLSNDQLENFFLKGLNTTVRNFLKDEMPTEVHPYIRERLNIRKRPTTPQVAEKLALEIGNAFAGSFSADASKTTLTRFIHNALTTSFFEDIGNASVYCTTTQSGDINLTKKGKELRDTVIRSLNDQGIIRNDKRASAFQDSAVTSLNADNGRKLITVINNKRKALEAGTGVASLLPQAQAIVTELQGEGRIRPTERQAQAIMQELKQRNILEDFADTDTVVGLLMARDVVVNTPDGKASKWRENARTALTLIQKQEWIKSQANADIVLNTLAEHAFSSAVSRAQIVGPANMRTSIEKPWLREPDASEYTSKEDYDRALARRAKGLNPAADEAEKIRQQLWAGTLNLDSAITGSEALLEKEHLELRGSVLKLMQGKSELVASAAASAETDDNHQSLYDIFKACYEAERNNVRDKLQQGEQFLYPDAERQTMAAELLENEIVALSGEATRTRVRDIRIAVRNDIESNTITSPMPGAIVSIDNRFSQPRPWHVNAGEVLCVVEAMKMQHALKAGKDGIIDTIKITPGQSIGGGDALFTYANQVVTSASASPITVTSEMREKVAAQIEQSLTKHNIATTSLAAKKAPATSSSVPPIGKSSTLGYNAPELSLEPGATENRENELHLVLNRGGCAAKITGDLMQAGRDVYLVSTSGDSSTPISKNIAKDKRIDVKSYTDEKEILAIIEKLAIANPGKKILLAPGWGFLSEKAGFVAGMEALAAKGHNVLFVGPSSEPMEVAGGKKEFRDLVQKIAPQFNPKYFGNYNSGSDGTPLTVGFAGKLNAYVQSDFKQTDPFHSIATMYRREFNDVVNMGGDVMIKAVDGGGGRGITHYKYDPNKQHEENYQDYVKAVLKTMQDGERLFNNGTVLTEQRIQGNTRHLEIQFAATAEEAMVLGIRDCTAQIAMQKFAEMNLIKGDYPPEFIKEITEAAQNAATELAKNGYKGLGTIEMLVYQEDGKWKACFLEVNPRLQVEHGVTERDIALKTGKNVSLPVLNTDLVNNPSNKRPQQILQDLYGVTQQQIQQLTEPADERIMHFRINSKDIDLVNGVARPTFVTDTMWTARMCDMIHRKTGATIIQGGLGDGKSDPQIGSILGTEKQCLAAAEMLRNLFRLSRLFDRSNAKDNLESTLQIYPMMFKPDSNNINPNFSTTSIDRLLPALNKKELPSMEEKTDKALWPGEKVINTATLRANLDTISTIGKKERDTATPANTNRLPRSRSISELANTSRASSASR